MADYRLNRFHWHLTEDQGWRLDIPGMPELVQYGAKRPYSPLPGDDTGSDGKEYGPFFYTVDDVKEIVEYADKRGIVVIPTSAAMNVPRTSGRSVRNVRRGSRRRD